MSQLIAGNSDLLLGPLGNVLIGFKGYDLGLTTADTALKKDEDVKDIMFSQRGTKPSDHVPTGIVYQLEATFGEIKTSLLNLLLHSFSSLATPGSGDDSGTFKPYLYTSLRDNRAGALRVWATDANGAKIEDVESVLNFYEAVPIIDANIINWGADTQRELPVVFNIYASDFGVSQVSGGPKFAFGYFGDPAQEKVPATSYPDLDAPEIVSVEATSATSVTVTFDENVALQGGSYTAGIVASVNGDFIAPTGVVVSTVTSTLTFAASSFEAGDVIELYISDIVYEDTETAANEYPGVSGYPVTNSVPE